MSHIAMFWETKKGPYCLQEFWIYSVGGQNKTETTTKSA